MAEDDPSWMLLPRTDDAWQVGFNKFIENTFEGRYPVETATCPCTRCRCMIYGTKDELQKHLLLGKGFDKEFIKQRIDAAKTMVVDDDDDDGDFGEGEADDGVNVKNLLTSLISGAIHGGIACSNNDEPNDQPNEAAQKFFKLMEEARKELYPGCKEATKVSFIVRMFQIKCMCGISNNGMEQILLLFSSVLPEGHCVPNTLAKVRKVIRDLGLDYQKIHACVNDCVLFRGEYDKCASCLICGESWWKNTDSEGIGECSTTSGVKKQKLFSRKILRYFPLIPRLQRLYMNETTSGFMTWHKTELVDDDEKMRHPANLKAWKHIDDIYKDHFAYEPRNVRLGLASDGFNPFGMLNVTYTTWPVILIPYNLPPWLCFKQSYWMMSMLVPGPKSPGMNIDVYLQPLIDELKELWVNGVETWDAKVKKNFTLRAIFFGCWLTFLF